MPFPETGRVIYGKNPLDKVVCQLRFPPILRIDSDAPSAFQDAIRESYPLYQEKTVYQQEIAAGLKPQFPQEVINQLTKTSVTKNHEFSSEDGMWKINLTRTFLAISTSGYKKWEEFKERFKSAIAALLDIYKPAFFTRTGLRYIDVFDRSKLDLKEDWNELKDSIESFESVYSVKLSDGQSFVRITTSLVLRADTGDKCFMVDSDFFAPKRMAPENVYVKLDFLNSRASRFIRSVITEKLHKAMGPTEICATDRQKTIKDAESGLG
jgi:uncharacterized protein (TIGR04255 family)